MSANDGLSSSSSSAIEANRQNFNDNWRANSANFSTLLSHFCMRDEMADVEFVFNRQNIITVCCLLVNCHFHLHFVEDPCSFILAYGGLRGFSKRDCLQQ